MITRLVMRILMRYASRRERVRKGVEAGEALLEKADYVKGRAAVWSLKLALAGPVFVVLPFFLRVLVRAPVLLTVLSVTCHVAAGLLPAIAMSLAWVGISARGGTRFYAVLGMLISGLTLAALGVVGWLAAMVRPDTAQ